MRFWLPYVRSVSGSDNFTSNLAAGLEKSGHEALIRPLPRVTQATPDLLRPVPMPDGVEAIVTNSSVGFAFARAQIPMATVAHHCVHDPAFAPFRSKSQAAYYTVLKRYEKRSFHVADETVAVSVATRRGVMDSFPGVSPRVIRNGIDTTFFTPGQRQNRDGAGPFRILFVGNLTRRKGADLLEPTMRILGPEFVLEYTSGLRSSGGVDIGSARPLGRLSVGALRDAYRQADALFLPSRLEGGPLVAFEAMACGLPVVASDMSAMPEVVIHGQTGLLCELDPEQFAAAFRRLAADRPLLRQLASTARTNAVENLGLETMASEYVQLFNDLADTSGGHGAAP